MKNFRITMNKETKKIKKKLRDALKLHKCVLHASLEQKALYAIEDVLMSYGCELFEELSKKQLVYICRTIYRMAHGSCKYHSCYEVHENWRKEVEERIKLSFKKK